MIGLTLASIYHVIGVLAGLVFFSFAIDIFKRMKHHGDTILGWPMRYVRGWIDWFNSVPNSFREAFGIIPTQSDPPHRYGAGYYMEVGIAHTALAWTGMAFYWAERNIGWMNDFQTDDYANLIFPFVFCFFYARGYLMHLRTIWQDHPWRWRLFLLAGLVYIPVSVLIRS